MKPPIRFLRSCALVEGISFVLLVFVAMPLKYLADSPGAVRIVGLIHGILFVAFCLALLWAMIGARLSLGRAVVIFISGLLPFGPFLMDRRMKEYEREYEERLSRTVA